jgi:hypothetical protein
MRQSVVYVSTGGKFVPVKVIVVCLFGSIIFTLGRPLPIQNSLSYLCLLCNIAMFNVLIYDDFDHHILPEKCGGASVETFEVFHKQLTQSCVSKS